MISLKDAKMKPKLMVLFLLAGLVPLVIVGIWSSTLASKALMNQSFHQLKAVQSIQKNQVENYFANRQLEMQALIETVAALDDGTSSRMLAISKNKREAIEQVARQWFTDIDGQASADHVVNGLVHFRHVAKSGSETPEYRQFAKMIDERTKKLGYYDFFVIDINGLCVYSAAKEADYKTNLLTGPYKDTGLGQATRRALKGEVAIEDFAPYAPSKGEAAAFIATPIITNGKTAGVVALQIPIEGIQAIVGERSGLGQTGESYLVGEHEGTTSYRSNRTVKSGKVGEAKKGGSINKALAGAMAVGFKKGSSGDMELEAYTPVTIPGLKWCLITTMALEEAVTHKVAGEEEDYFTKFVHTHGYYDLFLIEPQGKVFYSVTKEADYGTNMVDGQYADSGLGNLVRQVLESRKFGIADFSPYAPSNNEPSAFIAQPLMAGDEIKAIVALQLSLDSINKVMAQRDGMGETGGSYLIGPDKYMRSDSLLDHTPMSVKNSFQHDQKMISPSVDQALAGKEGQEIIHIIQEGENHTLLSSYGPIKVGGLNWALLAEIDEAEVRQPIRTLMTTVVVVALAIGLFLSLAAFFIAKQIADPLAKGVDFAKMISGKDLSSRLDISQNDEIGDLSKALNSMAQTLAGMIGEIDGSVNTVSSSATELASISDQLASSAETTVQKANTVSAAAEEMNSNMTSVASAMEQASTNVSTVAAATDEMSASIGEISQNAAQAKEAAANAVHQSQQASARVNELGLAAEEIGVVTETIRAISDKTDLLAMNATIEAARAGEAGKGFAVVASEIKDLAKKTAESTEDISTRLQAIQKSTGLTVTEIEEVATVIGKLDEIVGSIAAAVVQQNSATTEISENIGQTSLGLQEVNVNVSQTSTAAGQVAQEISEVNEAANEMSNSSAQVQQSAGELSKLSEQLKEIIAQFKV